MKALFSEIRRGDVLAVSARLDGDPQLVHAVAKAPPKKDDGQSTLQVAIKSGRLDVAHLLLDRGADMNYMDKSAVNRWNMPVVHDAVMAAVMSARYGRNRALPSEAPQVEMMSTRERFEAAFGLLERMVRGGADLRAVDSFGNDALGRAVLDARQVIDEPLLPELDQDLGRVFALLISAGADLDRVDPKSGRTLAEQFAGEPVAQFLRS